MILHCHTVRCLKQDMIALVVAMLIFVVIVILALASTIFPSAPALPSFDDPIKVNVLPNFYYYINLCI